MSFTVINKVPSVIARSQVPTSFLDKIPIRKDKARDVMLDITDHIKKLGLSSNADVICQATDKVAVQQYGPRTLQNNSPHAKIILKVTPDADLGEHPLIVTGRSIINGQLTSIQLRVNVQETR